MIEFITADNSTIRVVQSSKFKFRVMQYGPWKYNETVFTVPTGGLWNVVVNTGFDIQRNP